MKEVVECSKELVHLPHGKACLQCIVEGVKPTASNINQMSTIQLNMLSLEEVCKLQVDIWAVHTDGEKLPHIQFCNTFLRINTSILMAIFLLCLFLNTLAFSKVLV